MSKNIAQKSPQIKSIRKSSGEELRFALREYSGRQYADIRQFYRDVNDEWKPSRRGVTISPENWRAFMAALHQLEGELVRRGLLECPQAEEEGA